MTAKEPRKTFVGLCCECGTQRMVTDYGALGEAYTPDLIERLSRGVTRGVYLSPGRCTVTRVCATCGRRTRHAFLRDDADRDEMEIKDHLAALPHQLEVWEILNELRARGNVAIRETDGTKTGVSCRYYLYENSWLVTIRQGTPIDQLAGCLRSAQKAIVEPGGKKWWPTPEDGLNKPSVSCAWSYDDIE